MLGGSPPVIEPSDDDADVRVVDEGADAACVKERVGTLRPHLLEVQADTTVRRLHELVAWGPAVFFVPSSGSPSIRR